MNFRLFSLGVLVADAVVAVLLWARLPERVPTHYSLTGEPDQEGPRWVLAVAGPVILSVVAVLLSAARRSVNGSAIGSTAQTAGSEKGSLSVVGAIVLLFLALIHGTLLVFAAGDLRGPLVPGLLLALFQLFLGNALPRLRPSYLVGIRTPWTLSSAEVWRKTHRLGGKMMFGAGLVSLVALAVAPNSTAFGVCIVLSLTSALAAVLASYAYGRRLKPG